MRNLILFLDHLRPHLYPAPTTQSGAGFRQHTPTLPAVGVALLPAVGCALLSSPPSAITSLFLSCPLSGVASRERLSRPRTDPCVFLRTLLHVLGVVCSLPHQHHSLPPRAALWKSLVSELWWSLWLVTSLCHLGPLLGRASVRRRSCFVVRFGLWVAAISPKLWSHLDSREVTSEHSRLSRSCHCCVASCLVVSGHISTQTRTY